jgi:U4/U6 small nuclear ribonucleoprotein PRP3
MTTQDVSHLNCTSTFCKTRNQNLVTMADETSPTAPRRTRKRRWDSSANPQEEGKGPLPPSSVAATKNVVPSGTTTASAGGAADPRARAAALQASIQARLAAAKARAAGNTGNGGVATAAAPSAAASSSTSAPPPTKKRPLESENNHEKSTTTTKKARVYELDMSVTAPTRLSEQKAAAAAAMATKNRPKINPYLAHTVNDDDGKKPTAIQSNTATTSSNNNTDIQKQSSTAESTVFDPRIANGQITKTRHRSRPLNFITPGTYIAMGNTKREMAARAEQSGFSSGRKVGNVWRSVGMASVVDNYGESGGVSGANGSYYGSSEAGKLLEDRLSQRIDAPEVDIEEYTKKSIISKKDVEAIASEKDLPVMDALRAAESTMPYAMEWWDAELLPSKLRKELAVEEGKVIASKARRQGVKKAVVTTSEEEANMTPRQKYQHQQEQHNQLFQKCYNTAALTHSKSHALVQHPIPIITPAQKAAQEALKNKPPTLHLTKAEQKRHRKLRRAERLREQQDLQAAGLIPPPEPRLTLSNYMKVLGDQAVLDPSKMEARVMEQIQARKLKHEQMNADRKLTKEEKAAKHARKLQEDTSQSVCVALFWVRDMGHPYHRAKVDLNAQQNSITGGVLECETGEVLVVAEGGEKAIKRYTRLMTVRMKWKGEDFYEEEEEEEEEEMMKTDDGNDNGEETTKVPRKKFNPNNECELIWTGMAVKRAFHSFMFQTAANSTMARKILEAKGVAHYWDLVIGHYEKKVGLGENGANGEDGALRFRLGD